MKLEAANPAPQRSARGAKWLTRLAWLIALIALLRIGAVVFSSPIIGYANNYDFLRTSACTGIWQTDAGAAVIHPTDTARPTNSFVYTGDLRKHNCMRAAEVVFSKAATLWHRLGDAVDIREISALKVGLLALVFGAILRAVATPAVKLMLAAGFFLTLSDAAIVAYFNTLYTDSSTLPALFVAIAACVWIGAAPTPPPRWQFGGCAAVLLWLAVSKQQYGPLAAAFTLLVAGLIWLRWRNRKATVWMASCALLALVLFSAVNFSKRELMDGVAMANNSSMVLGAVLPEALDKPAAMHLLGLPDKCRPAIGQSWFTPGFQENNPCPEVKKVSRIRLIPLFVLQPPTFWQPLRHGIGLARPFYPRHLGVFEDRNAYANPRPPVDRQHIAVAAHRCFAVGCVPDRRRGRDGCRPCRDDRCRRARLVLRRALKRAVSGSCIAADVRAWRHHHLLCTGVVGVWRRLCGLREAHRRHGDRLWLPGRGVVDVAGAFAVRCRTGVARTLRARSQWPAARTAIRPFVCVMNPLVSIVVPAYNEAAVLDAFYERVGAVIAALDGYRWEILFVNDGSRDATQAVLERLHLRDACVGSLQLSRNFGKEIAMTAGSITHAAMR